MTKLAVQSSGQNPKYQCEKCLKSFVYAPGLYNHTKHCTKTSNLKSASTLENTVIGDDEFVTVGNLNVILKQFMKQNQTNIAVTNNTVIATQINNYNDMCVYLNKECKHVQSIVTFAENLNVNESEKQDLATKEYTDVLSSIWKRNYEARPPDERPLYCIPPTKRDDPLYWFAKGEEKWEGERLDEFIKKVEKPKNADGSRNSRDINLTATAMETASYQVYELSQNEELNMYSKNGDSQLWNKRKISLLRQACLFDANGEDARMGMHIKGRFPLRGPYPHAALGEDAARMGMHIKGRFPLRGPYPHAALGEDARMGI